MLLIPLNFLILTVRPIFMHMAINPQYLYFHNFVKYADRLCHLFNGGIQKCEIGVLYHAFAEWSGETMLIQSICRVLEENQIDCNIISEDYLLDCTFSNHEYIINQCAHSVLIVPGCTHLPSNIIDIIEKLINLSTICNLYFIDQVPEEYTETADIIRMSQLPALLRNYKILKTQEYVPHLNTFHYIHDDGELIMLMNTHGFKPVDTSVIVDPHDWCIYDAFNNCQYHLPGNLDSDGFKFHLHLDSYESMILVEGKSTNKLPSYGEKVISIANNLNISLKDYKSSDFTLINDTSIGNLAKKYPDFSGSVQYSFTVCLDQTDLFLLLEGNEIIDVNVNNIACGTRISPKYIFDISHALHKGENNFIITVVNNLARAIRDPFSEYLPNEPFGLLNDIALMKKL